MFVFLALQGTGGVEKTSAGSQKGESRLQNFDLARLQVEQVAGRESPFDFWIAGQSAGARAGYVGEDAIESGKKGEVAGVGREHLDVGGFRQLAEQAGAVRVEVGGDHLRSWIFFCEQRGFAAGSGAAVQNLLSGADEKSD